MARPAVPGGEAWLVREQTLPASDAVSGLGPIRAPWIGEGATLTPRPSPLAIAIPVRRPTFPGDQALYRCRHAPLGTRAAAWQLPRARPAHGVLISKSPGAESATGLSADFQPKAPGFPLPFNCEHHTGRCTPSLTPEGGCTPSRTPERGQCPRRSHILGSVRCLPWGTGCSNRSTRPLNSASRAN